MSDGVDEDHILLSTGKRVYTHRSYISVDAELEQISHGYDGHVNWSIEKWDEDSLTDAEAIEIADLMIARWTQFRLKLEALAK